MLPGVMDQPHGFSWPAALCYAIAAYSIYCLSKPLLDRLHYSTNLHAFSGPNFEGHVPAEPFLDGATHKPMVLIEEYGPVFALKRRFARPVLMVSDIRAVSHILLHNLLYEKIPAAERPVARVVRRGLVAVTGEEHRVQRKALNPAFGPTQIHALTGVFLDKANEMVERIADICSPSSPTQVNCAGWLSRCTLDIIGLAGFGYNFAALDGAKKSEMLDAVEKVMKADARKLSWLMWLLSFFSRSLPIILNKDIQDNLGTMQRIGMKLVDERKKEAIANQGDKLQDSRDLLSILVKANMSSSSRDRLSDTDLLGQIPTFLITGHDTTSNLLSWTIYELCCNPTVQNLLREQCHTFPLSSRSTGNAPLEPEEIAAFDRLPMLDAVIRETLRFHPPAPITSRMALQDDVLPLGVSVVDRNGVVHDGIPMKKGDPIVIPIIAINQSEDIWGSDAKEWKPSRWIDHGTPEAARSIPGVWGNMLTFLGGSHACIGYRFSLFEAKIILHALISKSEFRLAVSRDDIIPGSANVTRPLLRGHEEEGSQLPVLMTLVKPDE